MISGPLSDIYGRRIFLILSLVGSVIGYYLQYISINIKQFILFRSLTGLFDGSYILGQA